MSKVKSKGQNGDYSLQMIIYLGINIINFLIIKKFILFIYFKLFKQIDKMLTLSRANLANFGRIRLLKGSKTFNIGLKSI